MTQADTLDAAWNEAQAALPESKGGWGYSIHSLSYGTDAWCATALGNLSGERLVGYGATPVAALRSLHREAVAFRDAKAGKR